MDLSLRSASRVLIFILLAAASLASAFAAAPARAQEAAEPAGGDLVWTFAEEDPLFDQRVRLSLMLQMDVEAALAAGGVPANFHVLPANAEDREALVQPGIEADALVLLAAAGIDFSQIAVVGPCAVWVAPPPVEGTPPGLERREAAARGLGSAFRSTVEGLGAAVGECALTADPGRAQLLVWGFGETPPANPPRPTPSLFAQPVLFAGGGSDGGTGGGDGAADPAPPASGSGGLARHSETALLDALLLAAMALVLPLAARSLVNREER